MSREALVLQQFFEIVRHTDHVELDDAVLQMDPCGMNVSENHVLVMDVAHSFAELAENGDSLVQIELALAETLPRADMVGCLCGKLEETSLHLAVVEILERPGYVQEVWVIQVTELGRNLAGEDLLVLPQCAEVDQGD